jgi:antitoxin PrlF
MDRPIVLSVESTLTERYQTTIPEAIRKTLGLNKRDKVRYDIQADGQVVISRAEPEESDPILEQFLNFIAQDIEANPQHLKAFSPDLAERVLSLVAEVDIEFEAPLLNEDE